MDARARAQVVAALPLASLISACCFLGGPAPAPLTSEPAPTSALPVPTIDTPLPSPAAGRTVPVLGRQLTMVVPSDAPERAPFTNEPGMPGLLETDTVELQPSALAITATDLPCTPGTDASASAVAEIARRTPQATGHLAARPFLLADATLSAIEVVPDVAVQDAATNTFVLAWLVLTIDTHVVLLRVEQWTLAHGLDTTGIDAAARALAEASLLTLRRGDAAFVTRIGGGTAGDLFDHVDAPDGWVSRGGSCCNEQPPYTSRYDEHVLALRTLGAPTRARISARSQGACPPGAPGPSGTMLARAMTWTRTANGLCWVERAATADDFGITWHLRGATADDEAEALAIASSIRRRDDGSGSP